MVEFYTITLGIVCCSGDCMKFTLEVMRLWWLNYVAEYGGGDEQKAFRVLLFAMLIILGLSGGLVWLVLKVL